MDICVHIYIYIMGADSLRMENFGAFWAGSSHQKTIDSRALPSQGSVHAFCWGPLASSVSCRCQKKTNVPKRQM